MTWLAHAGGTGWDEIVAGAAPWIVALGVFVVGRRHLAARSGAGEYVARQAEVANVCR
ncbi:MAG: hypothetical protein AAF567_11600 [Actinomycetota bacterium]